MAEHKTDNEPWFYCQDCKSINVKCVAGLCYCNDCQSASIVEGTIEQWQKEYRAKYGVDYIITKK